MQQLFQAHPCMEGYEVIDRDTGRPVSRPFGTKREANGVAQNLNSAALRGTETLARALRAA